MKELAKSKGFRYCFPEPQEAAFHKTQEAALHKPQVLSSVP
jgi:hypothetical protein